MVFAINANDAKPYDQFKTNAAASTAVNGSPVAANSTTGSTGSTGTSASGASGASAASGSVAGSTAASASTPSPSASGTGNGAGALSVSGATLLSLAGLSLGLLL